MTKSSERAHSNAGIGRAASVGFASTFVGISVALVARSLSSLIVGALVPGVVALTSGRIAELVGMNAYKPYWGRATALFALGQAAAGYAMAGYYAITGSYRPCSPWPALFSRYRQYWQLWLRSSRSRTERLKVPLAFYIYCRKSNRTLLDDVMCPIAYWPGTRPE